MQALIDYATKISIFCNQHYSIFSRVLLKIMPVCEFKTVLRFPTVCFSKKKTHKKKPNFILIVSKARDILYFELRTCSNQTQLITAVNSRLERWLNVSKRTMVAEYRRQSGYLLKQVPGLTQSILAVCSQSFRRRTTNDRYSGLDPYWPDRRLAFLTVARDPDAYFGKTLSTVLEYICQYPHPGLFFEYLTLLYHIQPWLRHML